jgi:hypothetical protein
VSSASRPTLAIHTSALAESRSSSSSSNESFEGVLVFTSISFPLTSLRQGYGGPPKRFRPKTEGGSYRMPRSDGIARTEPLTDNRERTANRELPTNCEPRTANCEPYHCNNTSHQRRSVAATPVSVVGTDRPDGVFVTV